MIDNSHIHFSLITLFPEMFESFKGYGITGRAKDNDIVSVSCFNPRDFTENKHRTIDDRPFGGGPGMVMLYQPLARAVEAALKAYNQPSATSVIYLTPQGKKFDQQQAKNLVDVSHLVLICGRYEGVDERFIDDYVDIELSVGDFVVSGGEIPAMLVMDAITRLLPNALGSSQSSVEDSFFYGLLDCPHYTRPAILPSGRKVPEVLLSGHHQNIENWRYKQRLFRTYKRRPDLIKNQNLSKKDKQLLMSCMREKNQHSNDDE